jgi:hypothetical protein
MPSHRYISTRRGQVNIRGRHIGGAVPVVLNTVEKKPVFGGEITSNTIVGIITPQEAKPTIDGGKILKHMHFGHASKKDNDRIHFLF